MAEQELKKVLRVFVSSVGKMMNVERETLRDKIWRSGHVPIAMEAFAGNHSQKSVEVVLSYLEQADVVIFVLGYTYGSIIGKALKCKECPVRKCCNHKKSGKNAICSVSYTHFEYMYAKQKGILHYCIIQQKIDNVDAFKSRMNNYLTEAHNNELDSKECKDEEHEIESEYYKGRTALQDFIGEVEERWTSFYDAKIPTQIAADIASIYHQIANRFVQDASNSVGLVAWNEVSDLLRNRNAEIDALNKKIKSNTDIFIGDIVRTYAAFQPNTAVTGTCIPFKYDKENNEITTYLICNTAYKNKKRVMFPGGHAFSNDESPEAIARSKAEVEAGLIVKTIDLYQSFDVSSGHSEKSITSDFTVYRPPHYSYLFKQSPEAKCYAKNHHFHYDIVYVFEIAEVLSELRCSQERILLKLPNKQLTIPSIREEMNKAINIYNKTKQKPDTEEQEISDYLVLMLYEAHRDYVKYLSQGGKC